MPDLRPSIGICAGLARAAWGPFDELAVLQPLNYLTAIQRAGGLALMIPPDRELIEDPDQVLELLDGLILAGGVDIDPAAYGAEPHPETEKDIRRERDDTEIALVRRALELDLPVLGICRGMQVINVALGGTLLQHVPDKVGHSEHRRTPGTFADSDHSVHLAPGSLVARAAGEEIHRTKSHHHQAVQQIGEGLEVTGWATLDELPEAIEAPERRFVLGVQWHPEVDETSRLLPALVEEARAYQSARRLPSS
ncbi:MAG TPA: gamma-glutamyl-gamma-aminobutyrate hydrolase family protein [Solirubrobacteraceae bacterium]|jgi:putative glutamine amidotransferase|nr:gamma-glutamyl-gamma-aminobutyrate hydrolase family protein [Solirubrobacteraceae bacterium]